MIVAAFVILASSGHTHAYILLIGVGIGFVLGCAAMAAWAFKRGHTYLHRGYAYLHRISSMEGRGIGSDDLEMAFNPAWKKKRDAWLDEYDHAHPNHDRQAD